MSFNPQPLPVAPARLKPHDFTPFNSALDALKPERYSQLDALITGKTIHMLQMMVTDGQFTYTELTLYYLWRIREYDVYLNSMITLNPRALLLAQERDTQHATTPQRGDLFGIPIGLKDNVATDDMPNTAGAVALRDVLPQQDAFITRKLRDAGAIILGKLNLSEWARFMSTPQPNGFSALGGQTMNPYGAQFDTCGSSSGSAVAVSAGFMPVAIGTETSGSIICPAGHNSVYGLKPSLGLLSRHLIIPITDAQDTAGVMAIHAEDVAVVLNVVRGVDTNDPITQEVQTNEPYSTDFYKTDGLRGKTVGVIQTLTAEEITNHPEIDADNRQKILDKLPEIQVAIETTTQRLIQAGATVVPLHSNDVETPLIFGVLEYGLREGVNAYLKTIGSSLTLAQIIADNQADAATRIPYQQDFLEASQNNPLTADEYEALVQNNRQSARDRLDTLMAQHGLDYIVSRNSEMSTVAAMAGYPLLAVPGGYHTDGEPWGVTFMGKFLSENALLQAGYAYEKTGKPLRQEPRMLKPNTA